MIKIREGGYYETEEGWVVGPAYEIRGSLYPSEWAVLLSEGRTFEIVGVAREDAFNTKLVREVDPMGKQKVIDELEIKSEDPSVEYVLAILAERVSTLEKMVVMEARAKCGEHDVFYVQSDLVVDKSVSDMVKRVKRKMGL